MTANEIMEAGKRVNPDIFFLAHGAPVNTPEDMRIVLGQSGVQGFVGASSLERMGVEGLLTGLTMKFKLLTLKAK